MRHIGIVIVDRGAAIVTVEHEESRLLCTGIERLPFDLSAVAARVRELEDTDTEYVIDSEGLGHALWAVLGRTHRHRNWALYEGRGIERQALVDALLVAIEEDRFRFVGGLPEMDAMSKALVTYRRQVKDDGIIGSELVVSLLLAIYRAPKPPRPDIH